MPQIRQNQTDVTVLLHMQRDMSPLIAAGAIAIPTSAQQAAQLGEHRPAEGRAQLSGCANDSVKSGDGVQTLQRMASTQRVRLPFAAGISSTSASLNNRSDDSGIMGDIPTKSIHHYLAVDIPPNNPIHDSSQWSDIRRRNTLYGLLPGNPYVSVNR